MLHRAVRLTRFFRRRRQWIHLLRVSLLISTSRTTDVHPSTAVDCAFDPSKEYSAPDMVLLWKLPSLFCQLALSAFVFDRVTHLCAEELLTAEKVRLFGDGYILRCIVRVTDPSLRKQYGRAVCGFDQANWEQERESMVLISVIILRCVNICSELETRF